MKCTMSFHGNLFVGGVDFGAPREGQQEGGEQITSHTLDDPKWVGGLHAAYIQKKSLEIPLDPSPLSVDVGPTW